MAAQQPRGIRNNNPGNIRIGQKWQGLAPVQSDGAFCVFTTPQFGIRAIARIMLTYQAQDGCDTLRKIVSRWAPAVENDVPAYLAAVVHAVGVDPDAAIDVDQVGVMLPLAKAIILHENGQDPYPDSLILEALHMAGVADAKPKPLVAQGSFQAHAGAVAAAACAGCVKAASYAPHLKDAADQLSGFAGGAPLIQHAVTVLLTVGGGLTLVGLAASALKQRTL